MEICPGKRVLKEETATPMKLQTGFQFLTRSSWDSGLLTSAGRVAARDQLPRRDTEHTGDGCTCCCHPGIREAGTGEVIRHTCRLMRVLTKHLVT